MRKLFQQLVGMWAQLHGRLTGIESDEMVQRYKDPVRKVRRLEAIGAWRESSLAVLQHFVDEDLPRIRTDAQKNVTVALANLAAGRPPDAGKPFKATPDMDGLLQSERAMMGRLDTVSERIDGLTLQTSIGNAIALTQLQKTETLQDRVNAYLEDAQSGELFSYSSWKIDRLILPPILQSRAAGGDDRAAMVLEDFWRIERALIARTFPDGQGENLEDLTKTHEVIQGAIQGEGNAARENLAPVDGWFGLLQRAFDRQAQDPEPPQPPKPRPPEVDQDALNALAVGREARAAASTPISKLWNR